MIDNTLQTNQLGSANKGTLVIAYLPEVNYFIQRAPIPAIRTNFVQLGNLAPEYGYIPGDKVEFDPLEVSFLVDVSMTNWQAIYNWIQANKTTTQPIRSDATLHVLKNNYAPNLIFNFNDMFPISLAGPIFDSTETEDVLLVATVAFRYTKYFPNPLI